MALSPGNGRQGAQKLRAQRRAEHRPAGYSGDERNQPRRHCIGATPSAPTTSSTSTIAAAPTTPVATATPSASATTAIDELRYGHYKEHRGVCGRDSRHVVQRARAGGVGCGVTVVPVGADGDHSGFDGHVAPVVRRGFAVEEVEQVGVAAAS
jgi:hypothetical protein